MNSNSSSAIHAEYEFNGLLPALRSFWMGGKKLDVSELVDRWIGQSHWYFKVKVSDVDVYIVRYSCETGHWDINLYCREDYWTGQYTPQLLRAKSA